ncbi:hypothetical protein WICPIJ_004612 [Wickerhamomyces pijperi]|uniref:Mediator complex subunit 15 KIX domain-containing protein n=1 Tax=Wickerhamomyces pijperi TaxID=599730 RepID=A0A9P8TN47_WICPI|nr:hypothetical protein WICPIJ_004612 [Wickerhamomyces pijperi]
MDWRKELTNTDRMRVINIIAAALKELGTLTTSVTGNPSPLINPRELKIKAEELEKHCYDNASNKMDYGQLFKSKLLGIKNSVQNIKNRSLSQSAVQQQQQQQQPQQSQQIQPAGMQQQQQQQQVKPSPSAQAFLAQQAQARQQAAAAQQMNSQQVKQAPQVNQNWNNANNAANIVNRSNVAPGNLNTMNNNNMMRNIQSQPQIPQQQQQQQQQAANGGNTMNKMTTVQQQMFNNMLKTTPIPAALLQKIPNLPPNVNTWQQIFERVASQQVESTYINLIKQIYNLHSQILQKQQLQQKKFTAGNTAQPVAPAVANDINEMPQNQIRNNVGGIQPQQQNNAQAPSNIMINQQQQQQQQQQFQQQQQQRAPGNASEQPKMAPLTQLELKKFSENALELLAKFQREGHIPPELSSEQRTAFVRKYIIRQQQLKMEGQTSQPQLQQGIHAQQAVANMQNIPVQQQQQQQQQQQIPPKMPMQNQQQQQQIPNRNQNQPLIADPKGPQVVPNEQDKIELRAILAEVSKIPIKLTDLTGQLTPEQKAVVNSKVSNLLVPLYNLIEQLVPTFYTLTKNSEGTKKLLHMRSMVKEVLEGLKSGKYYASPELLEKVKAQAQKYVQFVKEQMAKNNKTATGFAPQNYNNVNGPMRNINVGMTPQQAIQLRQQGVNTNLTPQQLMQQQQQQQLQRQQQNQGQLAGMNNLNMNQIQNQTMIQPSPVAPQQQQQQHVKNISSGVTFNQNSFNNNGRQPATVATQKPPQNLPQEQLQNIQPQPIAFNKQQVQQQQPTASVAPENKKPPAKRRNTKTGNTPSSSANQGPAPKRTSNVSTPVSATAKTPQATQQQPAASTPSSDSNKVLTAASAQQPPASMTPVQAQLFKKEQELVIKEHNSQRESEERRSKREQLLTHGKISDFFCASLANVLDLKDEETKITERVADVSGNNSKSNDATSLKGLTPSTILQTPVTFNSAKTPTSTGKMSNDLPVSPNDGGFKTNEEWNKENIWTARVSREAIAEKFLSVAEIGDLGFLDTYQLPPETSSTGDEVDSEGDVTMDVVADLLKPETDSLIEKHKDLVIDSVALDGNDAAILVNGNEKLSAELSDLMWDYDFVTSKLNAANKVNA